MTIIDNEVKINELRQKITQLAQSNPQQAQLLLKELEDAQKKIQEKKSAWDKVALARHPLRPKAQDFVCALFDNFIEMHGDRCYGDDAALMGGVAMFEGIPVTVLAQCKGKSLEENMQRNFGMMNPEGYRKVQRLAKQAEKFNRPIITLIDTAGAYPGKGAEERGQAQAIAECLKMFSDIEVPVIAFVLSEGGSGGALAMGVADRVYMFENAMYSILSPEGFASILWKDESRAKEAVEVMRCQPEDLLQDGIIDGILKEPQEGLQTCLDLGVLKMKEKLSKDLPLLMKKKKAVLIEERYLRFRKMGVPQ